jgi:putative transposase
MLYISHTGCPWRHLLSTFAPWTRVWSQIRRWSRKRHLGAGVGGVA